MLWCAGCPAVTVPRLATPKPVTVIYPYYENKAFFGSQIVRWLTYAPEVRARLQIIVVDDGSPTAPAADVVAAVGPVPFLRVFRIDVNVRWNWLAARNIGFHHAADGWCLVTDMDHVIPEATLAAVQAGAHDPDVVYAFARREHTGVAIAPHSASFLMTRAMFWRIGGYDEALSGHYGTDGTYRRQLAKTAPIHLLRDELIRWEYVGDSSCALTRKDPVDKAAVKRLVAARTKGWKPRVLSMPYHEVAG